MIERVQMLDIGKQNQYDAEIHFLDDRVLNFSSSEMNIVNDELRGIIADNVSTKSNEAILEEVENIFKNLFPHYTAYQKSSVVKEFIKSNADLEIPTAFNDAVSIYSNIDFYVKTTAFEAIRDEFEAGRDLDETAW